MARVTVEDCLENVENRFKLVLLASQRARQLQSGADEFVKRGKDKDTVVALREIAAGHVTPENIESLHHKGHAAHSSFRF
jgi:DNA-directed RNA polymerase subunit omega